jgi:sulfite reductase alpha subunit-like flavoprotein
MRGQSEKVKVSEDSSMFGRNDFSGGSQKLFEDSPIFRHNDSTMTHQAEHEEDLLVLFGSQKGHSEIAADEFITKMSKHLSTDAIETLTGRHGVSVNPKLMKLDDFLKADKCPWTRLVVIVVSSFGTGDAPEGAKEFRKLADTWMTDYKVKPDKPEILRGLHFALLGFGDSDFDETFMENPKITEKALKLAGARMVGERGIADAFDGAMAQQKMIDEYVDGIWSHLANVVVQEPIPQEALIEMKSLTLLPRTN